MLSRYKRLKISVAANLVEINEEASINSPTAGILPCKK